MTQLFQPPFDGWPLTHVVRDDAGAVGYEITIDHLTPRRAKVADALSTLSLFAASGVLIYAAVPVLSLSQPAMQASALAVAAAATGLAVFAPRVRDAFRRLLRIRTDLAITTNEVRVRRPFGWEVFDRSLKHRFVALAHEQNEIEHEQNEIEIKRAQRRGEIVAPIRYYGHSRIIAFYYQGQRRDLMEIFGRSAAARVVDRLQAIDELVENQTRTGRAISLTAQDDWAEIPGALPKTGGPGKAKAVKGRKLQAALPAPVSKA